MKNHPHRQPDEPGQSRSTKETTEEIKLLNEQLTLTNEELRITNEELNAYKNQLEELVSIRTLELQKKEESLRYKGSLEKLLSEISTRFFNLSPELVDENINRALQEICTFIDADAAFLAEIIYSEDIYSIAYSWSNEKIKWDKLYYNKAPLTDIAWWMEKIREQDHFVICSKDDLPENSFVQSSYKISGTGSMIFVPIVYQGNLVGFTGYSSIKPCRNWNSDEISLTRVAGETFVNALKRKISEKILIESERNYREIFNASSEAILILDAATSRVLDVNQTALNLFGFTYEEGLTSLLNENSKPVLGFNKEIVGQYTEKTMETGPAIFEWQAIRKNGEKFWTEVSLKRTEIGGDMRILAVIRDISERKKSQELIMQSEERFRSIIQYLTDIIWIIDSDICITYESPSSWQVLGYPPGFLIGKKGFEVIHPKDMPVVLKELKKVLVYQNDHLPTEFRVKHANGNWISLEVIANNMLDHKAIKGIIITARDVTDRNRVEKALIISESKFRNIFNNSSDAIVILNKRFLFLEVNEVFLTLTGYTLGETRKMKLTDIITDPYLPNLVEKLARIFQKEHYPVLECEIVGKSKLSFPAEISSKVIDFEGETALIAVIRNITERRHMENKILDTIISTEERERERFARNLHDELGPLLSSIKMYVNSLSSATEKSKHDFIIAQLEKILTEVIQSTKELSNDLSPHVLSNYGLFAAIEWFIQQLKPYMAIVLESNLGESRYPSNIELSMYRIIKELINNSLKHAQANAITIKLHLILRSIHLIYSDNGTGFKENLQDNIESMGMGMSNIISRSRLINATCKFFNNAPYGMSFEMEVPVE
jgi:PAS domain S-box-containing protein